MSFSKIGSVYTPESLAEELEHIDIEWADGVCIHHTSRPNLNMRPKGWTIQHMRNIRHGYVTERGWQKGPHLFTDEDQAFGFSPMDREGIHARGFNGTTIGIEMLGDFDDINDFNSDRGQMVIKNTARMTAVILESQGWDTDCVRFHNESPYTDKTCPGEHIDQDWFLGLVSGYRAQVEDCTEFHYSEEIAGIVTNIEWQLAKLKTIS